jgi:hypothetical protein
MGILAKVPRQRDRSSGWIASTAIVVVRSRRSELLGAADGFTPR